MNTEVESVHDEETRITVVASETIGTIVRSEIECQLDAAHKYPRNIKAFLNDAISQVTMDQDVAMSCLYSLPRGGKVISGPSVRLAEICASAWGNLHMGARVVGVEDTEVIAQGVTWDLEKNNRVTIEVRRRITTSKGTRYNEDMITTTGNAAASVGFRNAIFRVIPRAYVNHVYQKAREVAVGTASTLSAKRAVVIERLTKMGILQERILARIHKPSINDITVDDMEILIGLGTAIKNGDQTPDEAFPGPVELPRDQPQGTAIDRIVAQQGKKPEPAAAAPVAAPAADSGTGSHSGLLCDNSDFDQLEILGTEFKVGPKKWKKHIEETMGFSGWDLLTKARLPEVQAWIKMQAPAK